MPSSSTTITTTTTTTTNNLVIIDYEELLNDAPSSTTTVLAVKLEQAFGAPDSLGLLAIRNVPQFCQLKSNLLPLAHSLVHLPSDYLSMELEDVDSLYNAGYSFGKEKLGTTVDTRKASFYFNPLTDQPGTEDDRIQYPCSYPCNKWPTTLLPALEPACKALGILMKNVVVELCKHLDSYAASKVPQYYPRDQLYNAMVHTEKAKGRLLYYFPASPTTTNATASPETSTTSDSDDSWIGWHNDSGFLTALAGDLYVHHDTGTVITDPDATAGLYVMTRNGMEVKVAIPSDCMAVQLGECVSILTAGTLLATPHCVKPSSTCSSSRGSGASSMARISLPVFIDTPPTFPLRVPKGCTRQDVVQTENCSKVPPLALRWTHDGMTFGDFLSKTFSTYYEWSTVVSKTSRMETKSKDSHGET